MPGLPGNRSLVVFNATAGTQYTIQVGSKTGAAGDVLVTASASPLTGGLSAYLATVSNAAFQGRDFVCGYGDPQMPACGNPLFILHNSTSKTLNVSASSDLGSGVAAPPDLTIGPGQVKTAKFSFTSAFDKTTPRTVSGHFTLIGRENATEIGRAQHRALIAVGNVGGNVLKAEVTPIVRAGVIAEGMPFVVELTNSGAQPSLSCHARSDPNAGRRLKTTWQIIDPADGHAIAPLDQLVTIPATSSRSLRVTVASQETRVADPEFPIPVRFDCANTAPAPSDLSNSFDITALGIYRPVQVNVAKVAFSTDTLLVLASGGVFRVSAVNRSATTALRALAIYARPFDECCDASKQFAVSICQTATATSNTCLAPLSGEVNYTATKDATKFFKVVVKPPTGNPAFDPTKRRVFFKLWQDQPTSGSFDAVVGAESVAVRKH